MLYTGYDMQRSWLAGAGKIAQAHADMLKNFTGPFSAGGLAPIAASALDVLRIRFCRAESLHSDWTALLSMARRCRFKKRIWRASPLGS